MLRPLPHGVVPLATLALLAGIVPATILTSSAAAAREGDDPPVVLPADPSGLTPPGDLGKRIDPPASYQGQASCAVRAMPGVVKLRRIVLETYGRGGSSPAQPRACAVGGQSEHKEGRAWDWMVDVHDRAERRAAADFLSWLTGPGPSGTRGEMASRLGVMYVIYNRRSWSSYTGYWKEYTGYDPHTSHVHISLSWNGARAHTSFWTGRVWATDVGTCRYFSGQPAVVARHRPRTTSCPAPVTPLRTSTQPFAWLGSSGSAVSTAQRRLGTDVTGSFDRATRRAVLRFQRGHDLPTTGALDDPTWAALAPATASTEPPDWTARHAARWARERAGAPALSRQSAGRAVWALQTALRMPSDQRSGYFGGRTAHAVVALKRLLDLGSGPRVTEEVWAALPAR
jgi:peptidoglycan hydrolase-like protein with peptidoglycan-binding domain